MTKKNNDELEGVEKVLKEPVFLGHDANTKIVRAQLLFVSAIALLYELFELKVSSESSFLGIKFDNLNEGHIQAILLILLIYLTIHFLWLSWNAFMEWRLRITGTNKGFSTGAIWESEYTDNPIEPRQSTLYNYYSVEMKINMKSLRERLENIPEEQNPHYPQIENILKKMEKQQKRFEVSARRFDKWASFFHKSQNLEWIFIEFSLPLVLSIVAISTIFYK